MQTIGLVLVGLLGGVLSGLLGIGGGVVLIPALVLLFGFSQVEAQGTTLAVMIPPIGLFAAWTYYANGYVRLPVAGWIAGGFMIGALVGAYLIPWIPLVALRISFGALMFYVGAGFLMNPTGKQTVSALPQLLAALVAAIGAWFGWRRAKRVESPQPPSDHVEYHV
jgi:uncharacterized membrane protein YfcA